MSRRNALADGGALVVAGAGAGVAGYRHLSSMAEYDAAVAATRSKLPVDASLQELVRFPTLAPNGHNTQPWKFRARSRRIDILPDFTRRTPVVDPADHHVFVSLGAAAENLSLAAAARGQSVDMAFNAADGGSITVQLASAPLLQSSLFDAIRYRQSTSADYDSRPVDPVLLNLLAAAASVPGVDTVNATDRAEVARVTEMVVAGNSTQMADRGFVAELEHWLRFNPQAALTTGDGLFSAASGSPVVPTWAGPFLLDRFAGAATQNNKYARQLRSSAGIAVFVGKRSDPEHWVQVGRACQRFALQATTLGLKHAFMNQPVEVARLRPELAALIGMHGRRPNIVMRFGHGPSLPFSMRRPVASVLV